MDKITDIDIDESEYRLGYSNWEFPANVEGWVYNKMPISLISKNNLLDVMTLFNVTDLDYKRSINNYHNIFYSKLSDQLTKELKQFESYVQPDTVGEYPFETQQLFCKILEVGEDHILVSALIDSKNGIVQRRKFDKTPLEGVLELREDSIFSVTILTKPGERRFIYEKANEFDKMLFKKPFKDQFQNLEKSSIFKPAKSNDENDF